MDTHFHPHLGLNVKLGRLAPTLAPRVALPFANYNSNLPTAPKTVQYGTKVPMFPMYSNDTLGDCTCAAAGHQIQVWTANAGQIFTPSNEDVVKTYWATGTQDTGRVESDVLNYWQTTGISGHKIQGCATVNPKNIAEVKQALWLFGGLYIGISLPLSAQSQSYWKVVRGADSEPGSWGGHAVNVTAFCSTYLTVITWGMRMKMSWGFWEKYVDEAYAVLAPDWIASNGVSTSGFNLSQLTGDLSYMH